MAKIVIGKMGRSMYFDRKKWKDAAGNNEAPLLFSTIAKLNPQNLYYIIGKSDFSRVDEAIQNEWFPHGNVVDVWKYFDKNKHTPTTFISEVLKDIDIDYGIIHGGMASLSIPNKIYCLDRSTKKPIVGKMRQPIQSLVNYCSPIVWYLNESGIDWMTVTSDGRYMPLPARDILNPEKISLGVREGKITVPRMKSYEDQETMIQHEIDLRYGAAEFQYMLDAKFHNQLNQIVDKTQKIALFFHQYDDKKRIRALEDFVIRNFNNNDLAVYGKWDPEQYNGPKFKGSVLFEELQDILPTVKYTFCYPIMKGDISGKWVEAVNNGIIPFFHETYDEDRLLVKYHGIPEWLYVSSPLELKEKIEFLESNVNGYNKMRNLLTNVVIQDEFKTGHHFNTMINKAVEDMKGMRK